MNSSVAYVISDTAGWLISLALFVLIFGTWAAKSYWRSRNIRWLKSSGVEAAGRIINVQDTNRQRRPTQPVVRLVVEIEPEGEASFTVEDTVTIMLLPAPVAGDYAKVYYDPNDRSNATVIVPQTESTRTLSVADPHRDHSKNSELTDDLKLLVDLHQRGALTDEEFAEKKAKVVGEL